MKNLTNYGQVWIVKENNFWEIWLLDIQDIVNILKLFKLLLIMQPRIKYQRWKIN